MATETPTQHEEQAGQTGPTPPPGRGTAPGGAPGTPEPSGGGPGHATPADQGSPDVSPDQLNRVLTLVRARVWVVLAALLVLVAVAVVWGFVGTIRTTIGAPGVVVRGDGVVRVQAPTTGQIVDLPVAVGTHVAAGDVVARVATPDGGTVPITAHEAGTVISLGVQPFAVVERGALVASIEPSRGATTVVMFVPVVDRPELAVGEHVQVHVHDVLASELGYVKGRVQQVGAYPAEASTVEQLVGTNSLANTLLGHTPKVAVVVALERDPTTASGFAWSSRAGRAQPVSGGQLVDADVVLRRTSLVHTLFP